ncbi:MAG: dihydropteroate synthase [Sphingobacteriales bacterium]|nr:MAG: dihydropteroate synthase [Sphingobacteriales bacterium]
MMSKNTVLPVQTTLQSRGRLLSLEKPVVMGILNATPDSFYNKGRDSSIDDLLRNAEQMLEQGAAILDIGGATTKPGAAIINTDEEQQRIMPALEAILKRFPDVWISVDTYNSATAIAAVSAGASIINDVSSGSIDAAMIETVAKLRIPYIAMHMQGTPQTMQQDPHYTNVVTEVRSYLEEVCHRCNQVGIADIIIDPGFGFGKTVEHNYALLRNLHTFRMLGRPILAGLSRKSMICKPLKVNPEHALNGTTALHMVALQQGANILRVHDVTEAMEVVKLWEWVKE